MIDRPTIRPFDPSTLSRRGFTLIELMVASLLLGMLVTILTMIFNQSSIAWRTGTAGVAELQDTRRHLGAFHDCRDAILPGVGEGNATGKSRSVSKRTVSLFQENANKLRTGRAYDSVNWDGGPSLSTAGDRGTSLSFGGGQRAGGSAFTVGVRSLGPDGQVSEDDITTWPNEVF